MLNNTHNSTPYCTIPLQLLPVKPPHLTHLTNPSIPILLADPPYPLPQHIAQNTLPFDLLHLSRSNPKELLHRTPINPPSTLPADQSPTLSLPINPKAAHLLQPYTPQSLSHACLLRAHCLLPNPDMPPTPHPTLVAQTPAALPVNQWITIDGATTIDRDDALMLSPPAAVAGSTNRQATARPAQLHIAIPIPPAYNPGVSSSIYLPDSSVHLLGHVQLSQYSLDVAALQKLSLVLTLNFFPKTRQPFQFSHWSIQRITIAHNLQFDATDPLLSNPPTSQNPLWDALLAVMPPNPLTPLKQQKPSQHLIEVLMVLTNTLASLHLQNTNKPLFWKSTPPLQASNLEQLLTTCTPQTLPPTHYSSTKPAYPWPFTPKAWLDLLQTAPATPQGSLSGLALARHSAYLQITSPLRRWTDLVNLHALVQSLPRVPAAPALPAPPTIPHFYCDTLINAIQRHIRQTQNFTSFQHNLQAYFALSQSAITVRITPAQNLNPAHSAYRAVITPLNSALPPITVLIPHKLLPIPVPSATQQGNTASASSSFTTTMQWAPGAAPPSTTHLAAFQSCPFIFAVPA